MFHFRRAFSIIELMVACSLFMLLLGIVFMFFRYGTRAFITANQRQGVQSDALRVMDGLQADLKRTAGNSILFKDDISRTHTIDGVPLHRDAVSFVSLKDWSDPTDVENFDPTNAQPKWNRYWVYYATTNNDRGDFVRLKVDPLPPPISPMTLGLTKLNALLNDNPALNTFDGLTPAFVCLARNVFEFRFARYQRNNYHISLKLQERRQLRPDGGRITGLETYQLQMNVRPENTVPQEF